MRKFRARVARTSVSAHGPSKTAMPSIELDNNSGPEGSLSVPHDYTVKQALLGASW